MFCTFRHRPYIPSGGIISLHHQKGGVHLNYELIGDRIRSLRCSRGITQEQLAVDLMSRDAKTEKIVSR